MKKSKFTEGQIVFALKQHETGVRTSEICQLVEVFALDCCLGCFCAAKPSRTLDKAGSPEPPAGRQNQLN